MKFTRYQHVMLFLVSVLAMALGIKLGEAFAPEP